MHHSTPLLSPFVNCIIKLHIGLQDYFQRQASSWQASPVDCVHHAQHSAQDEGAWPGLQRHCRPGHEAGRYAPDVALARHLCACDRACAVLHAEGPWHWQTMLQTAMRETLPHRRLWMLNQVPHAADESAVIAAD